MNANSRHTLLGVRIGGLLLAAILGVSGFLSTGRLEAAVIITNTAQEGPGNTFSVSSTDLLQTSLASASVTGDFYGISSGDSTVLYNGLFGASGIAGAPQSLAPTGNYVITFALDLSVNTNGYFLTQLDSFTSWDAGRDGQQYSVLYSTAFAPDTFFALATVPQFNPSPTDGDHSHTRVSLTDSTGTLASNVAKIRYTFTGFENGGTAYRELDIIGTSVPEPGIFGLFALGLGGLTLRRTKKRI
ncbi:PEP-CTERM sorting domain-containing protein [Prosthecobacter sp.]|uniref:PEP-CTERM sorting domain-containing protein n=1 Tax=Prosthecobacter sp. TaxID=1965333 RepID=UPI002AB87648|nr:PEP-CTERM sorting domain-containing protein [Prosthecobacter sp.]MDZ4403503.1 PEP-CTERM sorting domain-containing protein [Prosthecobacter sp.]